MESNAKKGHAESAFRDSALPQTKLFSVPLMIIVCVCVCACVGRRARAEAGV